MSVATLPEQSVADTAKTRTVRMYDDLVTMLKVIEAAHDLQKKRFKPVEYLDKLCRRTIESDYEKAREVIAAAD